jgi:hypothetical protein
MAIISCNWDTGKTLIPSVCFTGTCVEDGREAPPGAAPVTLAKPQGDPAPPCELTVVVPAGSVCTALVVLSSARVVELYSGDVYVATVRDGGDGVASCVVVEVPAGTASGPLRARLLSLRNKVQVTVFGVCSVLTAVAGANLATSAAAGAGAGGGADPWGGASASGPPPSSSSITAMVALEAKWARDLEGLATRLGAALDLLGSQIGGRLEALEARVGALEAAVGTHGAAPS